VRTSSDDNGRTTTKDATALKPATLHQRRSLSQSQPASQSASLQSDPIDKKEEKNTTRTSMDTNMEDVGRVPVDLPPLQNLEPATIPAVDGWIESLMNCKQLSELDVQRLCEKVGRRQ
jgi:hypothetical protein